MPPPPHKSSTNRGKIGFLELVRIFSFANKFFKRKQQTNVKSSRFASVSVVSSSSV
jgi:hypothetical protein